MALKTILFVLLLFFFLVGGFFNPVIGILGYLLHYIIGPERQWWHAPLASFGIRYSLVLALITAAGMAINHAKLRYGKLLLTQEKLALIMLALIWLLTFTSPETVGRYTVTDHASVKITKVMIFCFMMTHVITQMKDLDKIFWLLIVGSLILGIQAFNLPRRAFTGGRLDAVVGGSDFLDANALGAFMVAAVSVTGAMFMRACWWQKILCLAAGMFSINTLVLSRSRGALVALCAAGIAIILGSPKRFRIKLLVGLIVAAAGTIYLSDPQFIARISKIDEHTNAIIEGREATDRSTMMRIMAWRGGIQMAMDHPFGVGPGNFNQYIGEYSPEVQGLSPHSTYIQCLAELGFPGLTLFIIILGNGLWTFRKILRKTGTLPEPERSKMQWTACGLMGSFVGYAAYGLTGHLMYAEVFWWYLMMPMCLERSYENAYQDLIESRGADEVDRSRSGFKGDRQPLKNSADAFAIKKSTPTAQQSSASKSTI